MATLLGALGLADTDRTFVEKLGQRAVWTATQEILERFNADLDAAMGFFVSGMTTDYKFRYYLPGGGYMQRHNFASNARPVAIKATGNWDVALPIDDWRDAIIEDDIEMAYMRVDMFSRTVDAIMIRYANTMRREILRTIFRNTDRTFVDPLQGTLTVVPLANGDSVVYPPVIAATTEATDNHYLESGYASASISDTNNPLATIRDELTEHFGYTEGGENIVVLVNKAELAYLEDLTDFVPITDTFVSPGTQTATVDGRPTIPGTARLAGRCSGVWVAVWDWMPAGYMFGRHMGVEAPLMKREDPADTGLGGGLRLVARDEDFPFVASIWRARCGFGVTNRLNGVVMELGTGGSYGVPAAYA